MDEFKPNVFPLISTNIVDCNRIIEFIKNKISRIRTSLLNNNMMKTPLMQKRGVRSGMFPRIVIA